MRLFVFILMLLSKTTLAFPLLGLIHFADTIAPPPNFSGTISGQSQTCQGETTSYMADIPIGCTSTWYIDGIQQATSDTLEVYWATGGHYIIGLELTCDTNTYPLFFLEIEVMELPDTPASITGGNEICIFSTGYYSTEVGENDVCQWKIDEIIQPSDSAFLSYYWESIGEHLIEVMAINGCGESEPTTLDLNVHEWPVVDLGNDTTLLEGQSLVLDAGNPGCDFLWSTGDTTQTIVVTGSGRYEVVITNACGAVSDDINVEVLVGVEPEHFDQDISAHIKNDLLIIHSEHSSIAQVQVFDLMGRTWVDSKPKPNYRLPENGIFLVVVITNDQEVITIKLIK